MSGDESMKKLLISLIASLFILTGCTTPYLVSSNCNRFNCDKACHNLAEIKLNSGMRRPNACHQYCSNLNKCNCSPVQDYCRTKIHNDGSTSYDSYRVYPCKDYPGCGHRHTNCRKGPASCRNYHPCSVG